MNLAFKAIMVAAVLLVLEPLSVGFRPGSVAQVAVVVDGYLGDDGHSVPRGSAGGADALAEAIRALTGEGAQHDAALVHRLCPPAHAHRHAEVSLPFRVPGRHLAVDG